MKNKNNNGKQYIPPEEASRIIEEQEAPYKVPMTKPTASSKDDKEAQLLGSTKEAIQLRMAEIKGELLLRKAELKGQLALTKATESGKEKASKHLAVFGAAYLCMCVVFFLATVTYMEAESIAISATLITLVVTQLSAILKTVVDTKEKKDPTTLMHDIVQQQLQNEHEEKK